MIEGMLQSPRLEYHMKTIVIDQSLCNMSYFEHKCLNNIKNIYQHAGRCDDQKNLKYIIDAAMVLNPKEVADDIPNVTMTSTPVKKPSGSKSKCLFTNILNVKNKTAKHCVGFAKCKRRAVIVGNRL